MASRADNMRFIDTKKFHWATASACAHLAELSYKQADVVANVVAEEGFTECRFVESKKTDTQVFCMAQGNLVVIACRGTEGIRDFLTDAKFKRIPLEFPSSGSSCTESFSKSGMPTVKYGKVHRGGHIALESVWGDIRNFLMSHQGARIYITGHSLGGLLSVLLGSRLEVSGHNVMSIYTFGCPRVGNGVFARIADERVRHYRVRNNNDAVTRVPLRGFYRHSGFQYYFNAKGDPVIMSWFGHMIDHIVGRLHSLLARFARGQLFKSTDGLADHGMSQYRRLVDRASFER